MKQLRIWSFTLRHCEFVGCVVLRESRHCPLVRHKPTSRKGPKNPVLLTNHQLIFFIRINLLVNTNGQKIPLSLHPTNALIIFVILEAHNTELPHFQQQKLHRLLVSLQDI